MCSLLSLPYHYQSGCERSHLALRLRPPSLQVPPSWFSPGPDCKSTPICPCHTCALSSLEPFHAVQMTVHVHSSPPAFKISFCQWLGSYKALLTLFLFLTNLMGRKCENKTKQNSKGGIENHTQFSLLGQPLTSRPPRAAQKL